MPFDAVFRIHARTAAEKAAILDRGERITYRRLDRLVDGCAHALASFGVTRGNLVGVGLRDTAEHVVVLIALARMGAVILPMDCRWPAAEKRSVAGQFGAGHVLLEAGDDAAGEPTWHGLASGWFAESDAPYFDPAVDDDAPLVLSLSSGTTGMPKGPRATHRQFESRFMPYWINLGMNASDVYVSATPLVFGGGRGFTLAMLFCGATVALVPAQARPTELVAHVREVGGTVLFLVPTQLRRVIAEAGEDLAFPTMRVLISSGSALHPHERHTIRARLTPNLFEMYSSTEGGAVSVLTPADCLVRPDSVGRPAFRVQVQVVDPVTHAPLPPGEVGRLRYRSPASATGYYRAEDSDAFRDGWFYPGDLARLDEDGYLVLAGRSKDMIIRGGVNIYPVDIERVLLEMPGVRDAAVAGIQAAEMGEEIAAFLVADAALDLDDVIAHCRSRLASYKVPRLVRVVAEIPRNAGGKALKAELVAGLANPGA